MTARKTILALLAMGILLLAPCAFPAAADNGYASLFSDQVNSGRTISGADANGCFVTFLIANGSVHATIKNPGYATEEDNIPTGQYALYHNLLRIYVSSANNSSAWVDISKPTSTATTAGTSLTCEVPGQNTLAGDKVTFPLTITNNNAGDKTYTLSASSGTDWDLSFQYGGKNTYQLFVPAAQSKVVDLVAATTYGSSLGTKTIHVSTGDASIDLHVDITSVNQSADVAVPISSQIANIGDKIYYTFNIENLQSSQNNYKLAATGLPDNWYYQYLDSQSSTSQMAEVIVPAESTKTFYLQVLPPASVTAGNYNFTAVVTTPDNQTITQPLTLKLSSSVSMITTPDGNKLAYTSGPAEKFTITIYVTNTGNGGALTNVYPDFAAPSGWEVSASPGNVTSIKAGESRAFVITVQSPGNIVPSDYSVKVTMKSDQAQSTNDFRVTIQASTIIPYVAVGIIVVVAASLFFLYRKYGRR